jgi:excisionase family DNA binding protein
MILSGFLEGSRLTAIEYAETHKTVVTGDVIQDPIPPKPPELMHIPIAHLEFRDDSPGNKQYVSPLRDYLNEFFDRAERPKISQGKDCDYTVQVEITVPPSIDAINKTGGDVKGASIGQTIGGFLKKAVPQLNLFDVNQTNILSVMTCSVNMLLLDKNGVQIARAPGHLVQTNNLKSLGVQMNGLELAGRGAAGDAADFTRNMTRDSANQGLVKLAAYSAGTELLRKADPIFIKAANAPAPPIVVPSTPPEAPQKAVASSNPPQTGFDPGDWLTPADAAKLLKVSEADVLAAVEKGDIKARKIGSQVRINRKNLE